MFRISGADRCCAGQAQALHIIDENPTAEAIARLIFEQVQQLGFPVTSVRLWETEQSSASYAAP